MGMCTCAVRTCPATSTSSDEIGSCSRVQAGSITASGSVEVVAAVVVGADSVVAGASVGVTVCSVVAGLDAVVPAGASLVDATLFVASPSSSSAQAATTSSRLTAVAVSDRTR